MATICISGRTLEPASQLEGGEYFAADASQSNYILLHCAAQLSNEQFKDVAKLHVGILEYISTNTYLCWYKLKDLKAVRTLPFVIYANVYHEDLVVSSHVRSQLYGSNTLGSRLDGAYSGTENDGLAAEANDPAMPAPESINAAITLHPYSERGPTQIKQHLEDLLKLGPEAIQVVDSTIGMKLRLKDLSKVAGIDEVRSIDEIHPIEEQCTRARTDLRVPARMAGIRSDVLDARDEIVAVMERTGFDIGDQSRIDPPGQLHPALTENRIYWGKFANRNDATSDSHGHGTLVTGCVAANGRIGGGGFFSGINAKGTAPGAKVLVQANEFPRPGNLFPYTEIFDKAAFRIPTVPDRRPAYIHNNSWVDDQWTKATLAAPGAPVVLRYNSACQTIDTYLNTDVNRNFFVVWAAGNTGMEAGTRIGSQPSCKNVLTVGACESSHPITVNGAGRYQISPRGTGNPNNMATFSTPGPANGLDGGTRIKPDCVAPGIVLSCRSQFTNDLAYYLVQPALGAPPAPPVYNLDRVGHSDDTHWVYAEGTSFAAPFVSGMAAVIRKTLISRGFPTPTSALLKALVIHGATDLHAGPVTRPVPAHGLAPNFYQGWGRADLTNSLAPIIDTQYSGMLNTSDSLQQGDFRLIHISIPAGRTAKLISTMTYMDRQGDHLQAALVLSVKWTPPLGGGPIQSRWANRNPTDPDRLLPDTVNNVQKIIWPNLGPGNGRVEIRVEAMFVVPNVPGAPVFGGQDYAIVWQLIYDPL